MIFTVWILRKTLGSKVLALFACWQTSSRQTRRTAMDSLRGKKCARSSTVPTQVLTVVQSYIPAKLRCCFSMASEI